MYNQENNSQLLLILGKKTLESSFEAILNFFKDIKNNLVSIGNYDCQKNVSYRSEGILESHKNIILSHLDLLITISRNSENEFEDLFKNLIY